MFRIRKPHDVEAIGPFSDLAISIKGLTKFYKDFQALDNISFEVKRGDFLLF